MLMRHGVRPPTKPAIGPPGTADKPWPKWGAAFGELTPHGYDAVKLLGAWDREHWEALGLLPPDRCLDKTELEMEASYKSRTQDTARALAEGMMPGCPVEIPHPAADEDDYLFHPLATGKLAYDAAAAIEQARARQPQGGMAAEIRDNAGLFALLDQALGCCTPATCSDGKARACDLSRWPAALETGDDGAVSVGDPFSLASTIGQTSCSNTWKACRWRTSRGAASTRPGSASCSNSTCSSTSTRHARRTSRCGPPRRSPRACSTRSTMARNSRCSRPRHQHRAARRLLRPALDRAGYPRDDPPPGGAIGFELLSDAAGAKYVRAFYRSQTMPQVRELQPLDEDNPASWEILPIPGCAEPCRFDSFAALTRGKLAEAGFAAATPRH